MATVFWLAYAAIGVGVYFLIARAIDQRTGQAPQMGCFMWLLAVALWPIWVIVALFTYLRRRPKV
jgi:hypothetical protein